MEAKYVIEQPEQDDKAQLTIEERVNNYHVGSGWYLLPNNEKVRGKENAMKIMEELME